jgi:hypothetical protein
VAAIYNRLTQPGVTQGTLSIAPFDLAAKGTYDVQGYLSTRQGPGWIGFSSMLEHDINTKDDLDSVNLAITYDWRWGDNKKFWASTQPSRPLEMPAAMGLRVPEFNVKLSLEGAPGAPAAADAQRRLNVVSGATGRLPVIFSFWKQPSILSVLPVVGFEAGERTGSADSNLSTQPGHIDRLIGGVDASLRLPEVMHNFLGDKPITIDYSYRLRHLFSAEPYIDVTQPKPVQIFRAGSREYNRVTLIIPISAYFQIRASRQQGTLPPEFQYVGNLFTLGVTFSNPGSIEH